MMLEIRVNYYVGITTTQVIRYSHIYLSYERAIYIDFGESTRVEEQPYLAPSSDGFVCLFV